MRATIATEGGTMTMRFRMLLVAGLILAGPFFSGCGGDDGPTDPGNGGNNGVGGLTGAQTTLVAATYGGADDARETTNTLIENVAQAVEVASIAANTGQLVLTGTLTETGPGTGQFTWNAQPTDKMIVVFNGGPTFTIVIQNFEGFLDGDADDFLDAHSNFRFTVSAPGLLNLQIQSQTGAPGAGARLAGVDAAAALARATRAERRAAARALNMPLIEGRNAAGGFHGTRLAPLSPAGNVAWVRRATGTVVDNGVTFTIDLTSRGSRFSDVSPPFVELDTTELLSGTLGNTNGQIVLAEGHRAHSIFNSGDDVFVQNFFRENESEATVGNDRFQFVDLFVKNEFTNFKISEPEFWVARGTLQKNGTVLGQVDWSGPRIEGTSGPHAVIRFTNGQVMNL